MPDIRMPDGQVVRFPDEMPREQIKSLIASKFPEAAAQPEQAAPQPSDAESFGRGALDMASFGFDDEIGSGLRTGFGFLGDYNAAVEESRGVKSRAQETNPWAYGAGQVVGAVPSAVVPLGAAARGAGLTARVGQGALAGGVMGGLYGAGDADENKLGGAISGATIGGVLGGAIPVAGRAVGNAVGRAVGRRVAPLTDTIRADASALYRRAEGMGLMLRDTTVDRLASRLQTRTALEGFHPRQTPSAAVALDELANMTGAASLSRVDQIRQFALNAARSQDPNERRVGGIIIGEIDDFLDNLSPLDVNAGNARAATQVIREARTLWRRQTKARVIEDAIENARNAKSGFENGLRNEFTKLLKVKGGRTKYGWTDDELTAIRRVVHGGGMVGGNLLRLLGGFGLSIDQGRSFLGATIGAGIGASAGGPVGAMALPAIGTAAKAASRAGTRRGADVASSVVRSGGRMPMHAPTQRVAEQIATPTLQTLRQGVAAPALLDFLPR